MTISGDNSCAAVSTRCTFKACSNYSLQRCMCSRGHSTSTQSCVQNQLGVVLFHCESMFKNLYNLRGHSTEKVLQKKGKLAMFNSAHALEGNPLLEASERKCQLQKPVRCMCSREHSTSRNQQHLHLFISSNVPQSSGVLDGDQADPEVPATLFLS